MNTTEYRCENLPSNMLTKVCILPSGCWEWRGARNGRGYPCTAVRGTSQLAHRVSYEHYVGPIPKGLQVDHLCRVITCINPSHLEPVTQQENASRRPDAGKSHCKHGHKMTEANTMIKKRAGGLEQRNCRECERAAQRRRRLAVGV